MAASRVKAVAKPPVVSYDFRMVSVVPYVAVLTITLTQGKKVVSIPVSIGDVDTKPDLCIHLRSLPEDEHYAHRIYRRLSIDNHTNIPTPNLRQYIIDGLKSVDLRMVVIGTTRPLIVSAVEFLKPYL